MRAVSAPRFGTLAWGFSYELPFCALVCRHTATTLVPQGFAAILWGWRPDPSKTAETLEREGLWRCCGKDVEKRATTHRKGPSRGAAGSAQRRPGSRPGRTPWGSPPWSEWSATG